ncbi:MAG: 50S ribosomal protein L1 [Thermoplasmata archaeon M9B1D]|nr:MAG: 50S ribosomal protein L1 [Thermoplasmata archaeon M8B2D]PNX45687.1 MAG: 50S ribosomal protein L1 [Thermoplasmata archaeon M9B1D]
MTSKKTIDIVEKVLEESKKLNRKFKQNIDLVFNLKNIDLNVPKNRIDEEIILPHGRGNEAKIALFASGELAVKSQKHVDFLIKPEQMEDLAGDKKKFKKIADEHDFFIAEAPLMPTIGKTLGTVLGPRGKMPKPVPPNADVSGMVKNLRNTIKVRSKSTKTFHTVAGSADMSKENISENIDVIVKRVEGALERGRLNIGSVYIKTTMGPSVRMI